MNRFWAFPEEGNFDSLLACCQQPFVKISSCYIGSVSCRKWFISSLDHERGRSRCEIWDLCLSASPWGNKANCVPVKTLGGMQSRPGSSGVFWFKEIPSPEVVLLHSTLRNHTPPVRYLSQKPRISVDHSVPFFCFAKKIPERSCWCVPECFEATLLEKKKKKENTILMVV